MRLRSHVSGGGVVGTTSAGWRLTIPEGTRRGYRLAQLDDYSARRRKDFPWSAPVTFRLSARLTRRVTTGTWGFGLWNDSLGALVDSQRAGPSLPAPPHAAWFFWSSKASYISLRDDLPANGLLAQTFRAQRLGPWVAAAGMALVVSRKLARLILRRRIQEDSRLINVDAAEWHEYTLHWEPTSVGFWVDGRPVLTTKVAPRAPLGAVFWIDNQFAAFEPNGRVAWGFEATAGGACLEIANLEVARQNRDQESP